MELATPGRAQQAAITRNSVRVHVESCLLCTPRLCLCLRVCMSAARKGKQALGACEQPSNGVH